MKRIFLFCTTTLVLFFLFFGLLSAHAPAPTGYVNDFAGVLTNEQKQQLEAQLDQFEKETSNEIVVAIVKNLEGDDIETYAVHLFEEWKIGKEKEDNGILFLMALEEKKVRIEVGYGLEGAVTDGQAGYILDTLIVPALKKEYYFEAVNDGVVALMTETRGEYVGDGDASTKSNFSIWNLLFDPYSIFIIFLIFSYVGSYLGRSKRAWPGGVIGALGGGLSGYFVFGAIAAVAAMVGLGLIGFVFDYVVSKNYADRKKRGLPTDFWHGGGGFWGGGFGGFGGGGFGGFGGGGSGGGGSSRGW